MSANRKDTIAELRLAFTKFLFDYGSDPLQHYSGSPMAAVMRRAVKLGLEVDRRARAVFLKDGARVTVVRNEQGQWSFCVAPGANDE